MMKANHCEDDRHHGEFALGHGVVVVDVSGPCSIKGYQPPGVDCATKDILRDEFTLVPSDNLLLVRHGMSVSPLSDFAKPLVIDVEAVAMLEPLVDEHVGGVVVESGLDELCHFEAGRMEDGVADVFLWHCARDDQSQERRLYCISSRGTYFISRCASLTLTLASLASSRFPRVSSVLRDRIALLAAARSLLS